MLSKGGRLLLIARETGSCLILILEPTICTNFSNLFLELKSTCFGHFLCPSSDVFHCTRSNGICHSFADSLRAGSQQTCMTYAIAVRTVKNT